MAVGDRNDPFAQFNFLLEIDGLSDAAAGFTEVGGLAAESDIVEYREGSEPATVRKLPGLRKYSNITLSRGFTNNLELWEWRRTTENGQTERKSGAIVLLDENRQPVTRFLFRDGWISKLEAPGLNSTTSEAAVEKVEIVHEGLTIESA